MDQLVQFFENHTADILILILGMFTSICNFVIMFFRTKTKRLESIVNSCLRPHLDDPDVLANYYVKINNKLYSLKNCEIIKREESSDRTLAESRAALDTSVYKGE